MNHQWCMCVPYPEPPFHLPTHPIPQRCPSALALCALFDALNLDWLPISHMIIYMFQYYSLKSSHPPLFPVRIYNDTFKKNKKLGANESRYSLRG